MSGITSEMDMAHKQAKWRITWREKEDLNQTELAEKIGAKQKSISRYETGLSMPSIETLVKIAKVLKKPAAHFLEE